jgi:signal transduction histidine kinase
VSPPEGSLFPFLIELVAVFACGLRSTIAPAAIGLGAAVATEILFVVRTTNDFADYLFILVFLVGAWTAGRSVRARQKRADALFAETVRLEVEKEEHARKATEEEKARIAREMHDIISHGVSVMVVQAAAAERVLDQDPDAAREALRAIQDLGRDARTELRRMLGLMRPGAGDRTPQPGLDELPTLLEQVRRTGLDVAVRVSGVPVSLSPGVALTAYRVLQEGLTNAVAHGSGHRAEVDLAYTDDAVTIEMVNDSEIGNTRGGGHGLVGMAERLQLYGGSLHHERDSCGQFRLRARLPYSGDVR